jgi:hypothetical protein
MENTPDTADLSRPPGVRRHASFAAQLAYEAGDPRAYGSPDPKRAAIINRARGREENLRARAWWTRYFQSDVDTMPPDDDRVGFMDEYEPTADEVRLHFGLSPPPEGQYTSVAIFLIRSGVVERFIGPVVEPYNGDAITLFAQFEARWIARDPYVAREVFPVKIRPRQRRVTQ